MNTEHELQHRAGRRRTLNSSETVELEKPQNGELIEISVETGLIRISTNQANNVDNLTLGFACRSDNCRFGYPEQLNIKIEAITDTTYEVKTTKKIDWDSCDTIVEWIIQLHVIRNESNLEHRLLKLFKLLTTKLGKRTPEGLLLECTLSHVRIAEITGSTRSTVSRAIGKLRKTNQIHIDKLRNQTILPMKN